MSPHLLTLNEFLIIFFAAATPKRFRRNAPNPPPDSDFADLTPMDYNNGSVLEEATGTFGDLESPQKVFFRRVPKEVS